MGLTGAADRFLEGEKIKRSQGKEFKEGRYFGSAKHFRVARSKKLRRELAPGSEKKKITKKSLKRMITISRRKEWHIPGWPV